MVLCGQRGGPPRWGWRPVAGGCANAVTLKGYYGLPRSARVHRRAGEEQRTAEDPVRGGPDAGDHRVRRSRGEAKPARAAVRKTQGVRHSGADQLVRVDAKDG